MGRPTFDQQLRQLNDDLIVMSIMVENSITGAVHAVTTGDTAGAQDVIDFDAEIDDQERAIETLCLKLLLQQQPVASDLRCVSAALKMITDLERIGDQAADICDIVEHLPQVSHLVSIVHLSQMAEKASTMVRWSIDSFVSDDLVEAHLVMDTDDEVDALFVSVRGDIIDGIRSGTADEEEAMDFLMVAKYLERIADHATNIAEWAEYAITGVHKGQQIALG